MSQPLALRRVLLAVAVMCGTSTAVLAEGEARHGETLYKVYCTQCHGIEGDGYGINTPDMAVLPRDHTDSAEMSARTDDDLFKAIQGGGKAVNKSVLMPSWSGNLSEADIRDIIAYLRELCCKNAE